jgi:hypothetical protein
MARRLEDPGNDVGFASPCAIDEQLKDAAMERIDVLTVVAWSWPPFPSRRDVTHDYVRSPGPRLGGSAFRYEPPS